MTHPSDADADQMLGGALFCLAGGEIEGLLGSDGNPPNVVRLAVIFFLMCTTNGLDHRSLTHAEQGYCTVRYFFMATQDIAVDGWSVSHQCFLATALCLCLTALCPAVAA